MCRLRKCGTQGVETPEAIGSRWNLYSYCVRATKIPCGLVRPTVIAAHTHLTSSRLTVMSSEGTISDGCLCPILTGHFSFEF